MGIRKPDLNPTPAEISLALDSISQSPSPSPELCSRCGLPYKIGDWPICPHGRPGKFWTGDANIHSSEKISVDYNPRTGVTHIPGRTDRPMHIKKIMDGFERRTLDSFTDIKQFEKQTGLISEATNYHANSHLKDRDTGSD
jgi:hypothetical protein